MYGHTPPDKTPGTWAVSPSVLRSSPRFRRCTMKRQHGPARLPPQEIEESMQEIYSILTVSLVVPLFGLTHGLCSGAYAQVHFPFMSFDQSNIRNASQDNLQLALFPQTES